MHEVERSLVTQNKSITPHAAENSELEEIGAASDVIDGSAASIPVHCEAEDVQG
jgi:hypothetical protein